MLSSFSGDHIDNISCLHGVRLGHHERWILLTAPRAKELPNPGFTSTGMLSIDHPDRSTRASRLRAARRLRDLGLVEYTHRLLATRGQVHVYLTARGSAVVDRNREELESGRRIRWRR
jgi:hypothetical protein